MGGVPVEKKDPSQKVMGESWKFIKGGSEKGKKRKKKAQTRPKSFNDKRWGRKKKKGMSWEKKPGIDGGRGKKGKSGEIKSLRKREGRKGRPCLLKGNEKGKRSREAIGGGGVRRCAGEKAGANWAEKKNSPGEKKKRDKLGRGKRKSVWGWNK